MSQTATQFVMHGRIKFTSNLKIPSKLGARLTVELQDTTLADAPARVITKVVRRAFQLPMSFAVKYSPSVISKGRIYSLSAIIRDKNKDLLFINDQRILVTPIGKGRTKFINVPMVRVKSR